MDCPWCGDGGGPLSQPRSKLLFTGGPKSYLDHKKAVSAQGGVMLPPDYCSLTLRPELPKTWHCRTCRKLVIPY